MSAEADAHRAELTRHRDELIKRTEAIGRELSVLEHALGPRWASALAWSVNIGSAITAAFGFAGGITPLGLIGAGLAIGSWLALGVDRINRRPVHERLWLLHDELKTIKRELARIDAELAESPP